MDNLIKKLTKELQYVMSVSSDSFTEEYNHDIQSLIAKANNTEQLTGIDLIATERREQIEKHGRTLEDDKKFNTSMQLISAAHRIIEISPDPLNPPHDWNPQIWERMCGKPMIERLIIGGAFLAAEIDRLRNTD